MTGAKPMAVARKKTSLGLVALMMLSLFSALIAAPNAAAIEQVDLAILSGQSPVEDRYYPAFDPITFSAEIENQALSPQTSTRTMGWYVCSGIKTVTQCVSNDVGIWADQHQRTLGRRYWNLQRCNAMVSARSYGNLHCRVQVDLRRRRYER